VPDCCSCRWVADASSKARGPIKGTCLPVTCCVVWGRSRRDAFVSWYYKQDSTKGSPTAASVSLGTLSTRISQSVGSVLWRCAGWCCAGWWVFVEFEQNGATWGATDLGDYSSTMMTHERRAIINGTKVQNWGKGVQVEWGSGLTLGSSDMSCIKLAASSASGCPGCKLARFQPVFQPVRPDFPALR